MQGQALHISSMLDCGNGYHQKGREEDLQLSEQIKCIRSTLGSMGERLKYFYLTDGRLAKLDDNSFVFNISAKKEMQEFKLLAKKFIGCRLQVYDPWKLKSSGSLHLPFSTPSERDSETFDSLKVVCQYLGLSVPQRRSARKIISPQVIQYDMLRGALEELVRNLDVDLGAIDKPSNKVLAAKEASARSVQLLSQNLSTTGSASWAKLSSYKNFHSPKSKWGDVLESFEVILDALKDVDSLKFYVITIEGMKEGLGHIKNVQLDNNLDFKKIHHRKSYVEHKLVYNLGYTSKCLFTLLVFYLFQSIRSITVDMAGGLYGATEEIPYVSIGEIITSADRKMLWIAVKHLDKALGLIRFISEIIGTKNLKLEGHIWALGAQETTIDYRGNSIFVHAIE
ncbi:hypothetical protein SUGI_0693810 [Cryptomeria japonica]|nr:hypothetical protein SUGI_0693810 [Cryptomeria japonica]